MLVSLLERMEMTVCVHHRERKKICWIHPQNEDLPDFFPLVFTEGLFSLENSRTIWQVCLKMFMTVLTASHLWNIVCAGAWGIAASIFPGRSSTVLSPDFGTSSFYMKKQMGERALLRGPNTFLAQRYFKHKSARRPQEVSGSKFSQQPT